MDQTRLTKMFKVGKMGHSILGFSAGHSIKYGLSKVQAMACEIPVSNQTGMGKAPATRMSVRKGMRPSVAYQPIA